MRTHSRPAPRSAPSARLLALNLALSLGIILRKMPFVWDFLLWDLQTDAALLALLLLCGPAAAADGDRAVALAAPIVRAQYVVFYACTALWKVNAAFLDASVSCAPIFFAQLLDAYVPAALTPPWLPPLALALAPAATILVEAAIPALLCVPAAADGRGAGAACRRLGLGLGVLLHLLIALTPAPNNAGAFSLTILVHYFFLAPRRLAAAAARPAVLAASALLAVCGFCRAPSDLAVGMNLGLALLWAAALLTPPPAPAAGGIRSPPPPPPPPPPALARAVRRVRLCALGVAVGYALLLPVLGLQDMMASTMFANLRVYSGSNHRLLPTGLLFGALPALDGGAAAWVEATSSRAIAGLYTRRRRRTSSTGRTLPRHFL